MNVNAIAQIESQQQVLNTLSNKSRDISIFDTIAQVWGQRWRYNIRSGNYEHQTTFGNWEPYGQKELSRAYVMLYREYGLCADQRDVKASVEELASQNRYDPVKEYILGLEADESVVPDATAERMMERFFGCKDPLSNRMWLLFMVAAVKRLLEPGCAWKYLPILAGPQSIAKSWFVEHLFGTERYSNQTVEKNIRWNQLVVGCQGNWVNELAECDHLFKGDQSRLKNFVSSSVESVEAKYKNASKFVRDWVMVGTTNRKNVLSDPTGAVRWWLIDLWHLGEGDLRYTTEELHAVRDGVWKYVVQLYREQYQGVSNPISLDESYNAVLLERQADAAEHDPTLESLRPFVDGKPYVTWQMICTLLDLDYKDVAHRRNPYKMLISDALLKLGYEWSQRRHSSRPDKFRAFWPV